MTSNIRRNPSEDTLYDEAAPLLVGEYDDLEIQKPIGYISPIPKYQLAAICFVRLADPVAFTQIFPYINELIRNLHLTNDPTKTGYYSGIVESSFAFAQLCSIYHWARFSDVVGRRPVIVLGTLGLAIATVLLGFSTNLQEVITCRVLAGLFSGIAAVIHSALGELTDGTNQHIVFPIFGLFWPLGAVIGPLIGGSLSNVATRNPLLFDYLILRRFPYLLPCLVASSVALSGSLLTYLYVNETLPRERREDDPHNNVKIAPHNLIGYGATSSEGSSRSSPLQSRPPTIKELLAIPIIRTLSLSGCALCFVATAFDAVFVLFCYTPVSSGGLSFTSSQIGYSMATAGALSASIQLLIMPTLLRSLSAATLYYFCMAVWPITFIGLPFLNLIARTGYDENTQSIDPRTLAVVWACIGFILACSRVACLAYSVSMILIKENAPTPSALGSSNGLVQFCMCISRTISPSFVSSIFAASIKHKVLGGNMWVLIMVCICCLGLVLSRQIARNL